MESDKRKDLKKTKKKSEEKKEEYKDIHKAVIDDLNKAKEDKISEKCIKIESNLSKNNNKKAYELVKELTSTKQERSTAIQNKKGELPTEEKQVLDRSTEYCSELFNYKTNWDPDFTRAHDSTDNESDDILRDAVEAAVKILEKG